MAIVLGSTQYGKAETRLVRVVRDHARHEIRDVNVTTALRGDFADAHLLGDQAKVLPTDTQKNTAYAFAKQHGLHSIEQFGTTLATHFVEDIEPVTGARVELEEYAWQRVEIDGDEHDHTWVRSGQEVRTAAVTAERTGTDTAVHVIGGLKDLVLLKSTGSEFSGFLKDPYTTLPETDDRIMATSLVARWRFRPGFSPAQPEGWNLLYASIRAILLREYATVHSLALQQTLWHMGRAVLENHDEIVELTLSAPNKHHFLVDLSPFGLENPGEVFFAADRPYGLIQATVVREDAPDAGSAWRSSAGLA